MGFLDRRAAVGVIFCVFSALARADADPAPLAFPGSPAGPPEAARWRAAFSPLTLHFSSDSFGQPSGYAFGGQQIYRWSPWEPMYAEWTAGLLYGYKGEYKHKVPFNYNGFSPGLTVGIGWRFSPTVAGQVNLLGTAGLMFLFTYELP
jgi:hypothetical protein